MPVTREDLVKIAREVVEKTTDQHDYFGPVAVKFDPHEWVLEAMRAAYERGRLDEAQRRRDEDEAGD